ncbi:alpha/beta hydrolase [Thioalkalivibrio thiocyanodenitrificans]|uniref:alpha/beta hydrolase n=1 Tax=Thioalkalivibrio thiocyanodenitrificans TaxID=243063 RepID=UPI00035D4518
MPFMPRSLLFAFAVMLAACGQPQVQSAGAAGEPPRLHDDHVVTDDGYTLPLHRWMPDGKPVRAVALGLHGFGDYGAAFEALSGPLSASGIALYAYDQRGFGSTGHPGIWAGRERLVADVSLVVSLLRERHEGLPVYLLGKSMGGAVALLAVTGETPPAVDGTVYIAPAVWGRETMPWYQRLGLWIMLRIRPGMYLSGDAAHDLGIRPTDDPEVARALSRDPLVQKRARIDTIHGLTSLMGEALDASAGLPGPALILYGDNDQVIPPRPVCAMLERLPAQRAGEWRMALYPDGYHMLTRYTGAAATHGDVAAWLLDPSSPLPSGEEVDLEGAWSRLCPGDLPG